MGCGLGWSSGRDGSLGLDGDGWLDRDSDSRGFSGVNHNGDSRDSTLVSSSTTQPGVRPGPQPGVSPGPQHGAAAAVQAQPPAAGLWLDVDTLLELPVATEARVQLWRLALRQRPQAPAEQQLPLVVALARHCGLASSGAAADGQWGLMRQELEEAIAAYQRLAELAPERAAAARQELGNLIAKLTGDLHACVHGEEQPEASARGALCWQGYELGQLRRRLQLEQPDWLWHLEEQLVREGALTLRQLASESEASTTDEPPGGEQVQRWRRQALELLLNLGRLHQPPPEWILLAARELLAAELENLMGRPAIEAPAPELQQLLTWTARLPLPQDSMEGMQLAVQRGIWSLQLLESSAARPAAGGGKTAGGGATEEASPVAPAAPQAPPGAPAASPAPPPAEVSEAAGASAAAGISGAAQAAIAADPRVLYRALQLGVEAWLADHPAGLQTQRLEPVLRPGAEPVLQAEGKLQLNLAPLLAFPQVELLDQLLPAFFTPLQDAGRGSELQLAEPNSALWHQLTQLWQAGGQLNRDQWRALVYCTALWSRCGGPGALAAQPRGWDLPIAPLQPGQSLLRPGNVELAALQTVLGQRDELEELLAEIRRRHHDRAWMESQRDTWWYDPSDGSENLRRLHTNAGFYASSHAPLESLQRWSQGSLRALLAGPVLFGNDSISQMFWPVAQLLVRQSRQLPQLVQWPGEQAFYDFIAGQELLFVTPLAADVEAHHRSGRAFALFDDIRIAPYGLRCIEAPMSIYPNRPDRGFEDSLERTLEQIDRAYRQKPFAVFTAACGAYGLPLCEAVKTRYGVSCLYVGNLMHAYFGVLQNTTADWRSNHRIAENWINSHALDGVPGVNRLEGGRYLG